MDTVAFFRVREETTDQIKLAIRQHKLSKDTVSGFRYNSAVTFIKHFQGVLEDDFFDKTTNGMKGLASPISNILTRFKANVAITRADIKRQLIANGGEATQPKRKQPQMKTPRKRRITRTPSGWRALAPRRR